jgi:NADH-quinone oxidoreductase subunit N
MTPAYDIPTINWMAILPVAIVVITGILGLLVEMMRPKSPNGPIIGISIVGLIAAGVATIAGFSTSTGPSFAGLVWHDSFGSAIELILIISALITTLFSEGYLREKRIAFGEFYPLMLWSTSGAMIMATTRNLLMVFIGLEVLSIALYVLAGLSRSEEKSEEAAIKYFLLGAFASAFLLYGIAFFYGATGALDLAALHSNGLIELVPAGQYTDPKPVMLIVGLGLMLVGFAFKCGFVPFHQWTPDVYQGAPTNVTGFMAAAAKLGAFAALFRVLEAFGPAQAIWLPPLFWIAIVTMTVGNFAALVQKDVKRILGYSSISHAGYLLVAVLAHAKEPQLVNNYTVIYYLLGYSVMTVGAFSIVALSAKAGNEGTRLDSLHGLYKRTPFAAVCLLIFMMSLVGLPPTVGFVGKLLIFKDALAAGLAPLAIVMALNSAVSAYYYLGIAWAAFRPVDEASEPRPMPIGIRLAGGLCALSVFAAVFLYGPIQDLMSHPAASVLVRR